MSEYDDDDSAVLDIPTLSTANSMTQPLSNRTLTMLRVMAARVNEYDDGEGNPILTVDHLINLVYSAFEDGQNINQALQYAKEMTARDATANLRVMRMAGRA